MPTPPLLRVTSDTATHILILLLKQEKGTATTQPIAQKTGYNWLHSVVGQENEAASATCNSYINITIKTGLQPQPIAERTGRNWLNSAESQENKAVTATGNSYINITIKRKRKWNKTQQSEN